MRHLPLILICLLAFLLRLHKLEAVPLRGDEAFSVQYWAGTPLAVSLGQIAQGEPHTPLVYAVARAWGWLIGGIDSVFALRMLSALGNMLGVAGICALGWRLSGQRGVGLLAALLWALHPYEIWHSHEFRNYGYWASLSVISLWLGLRLVERGRRVDWLLYAFVGGFAALTIYTEGFSTLAVTGLALIARWKDKRFLARLLALQALMALLLAAGFALLALRTGYAESYPGLQPAFSLPEYVRVFAPTLLLGSSIPLAGGALGAALTPWLLASAALVWRVWRRAFALLTLAALLPLLGLGIASQRWDLFHPRYVLSVAPALLLLLVCGSWLAARWLARRTGANANLLTLLLLSAWFALALHSLDGHYNNPAYRKAPAWDELGAFLNGRVRERDLVIQLAGDAAFGYYYRGAARDMALPVNGAQPIAEIHAQLDELQGDYDSIYTAAREQAGWVNAGAVDAWLAQTMQEALRTNAAGMPVRQYLPRAVNAGGEALATFGGIASLLRYNFFPEPLPTGEWLLWLEWLPLARSQRPLKTFAHVYGATNPATGGSLWTQADQYPQAGALDTTDWAPGAAFRDVFYLPAAGLPAGEYALHVGWYDESTGARLRTDSGEDSFLLEEFRIAGQ